MHTLYSEPCKICGSKKNYLIENDGRKSLFCESCNHFEDVYVSDKLKQKWENEAKEKEQAEINAAMQENINVPKCPICQSTNLSKITATKKAMKIAAFGIFGMGDNGKTWKCNSCGSKF